MRIWVRVKHEEKEKALVVEVETTPTGDYTVLGGRLEQLSSVKFKPDDFSKIMQKHGFDEDEARFVIEEAIESHQGEGEAI